MDLSSVTFDYATILSFAVTVVTALAALWVVRKAIKLANRS